MFSIRSTLKRNRFIHTLGKEVKRSAGAVSEELRRGGWRRARRAVIDRYLAGSKAPKLHVGCGPMAMDGWLNTDMQPATKQGVVYLDICERLPFPDDAFVCIFSEHVIEHISLEQALDHLRECHRILKPGGILRVAMPDLSFLLDYYREPQLTQTQQAFLNSMSDLFHPGLALRSPTILLNDFVRRWGHQFIYDRRLFHQMMEVAGFSSVVDARVKQSVHQDLVGLERHGVAISDAYNELQTMVLEGEKGAAQA